jgi:hypothetical protein
VRDALHVNKTKKSKFSKSIVTLNLESTLGSSSQSAPRALMRSDEVWEFPPNGEIAIMICGDSKIVADNSCGLPRVIHTKRFRLSAPFKIIYSLWERGVIGTSNRGAKYVRHIYREVNKEADVVNVVNITQTK